MSKLVLFNKTNCAAHTIGAPTISISPAYGGVSLNPACVAELGLEKGSKVHFATNPGTTGCWLLLKAEKTDKEAFVLVNYKGDKALKMTSKSLATKIKKDLLRKDDEAIVFDVETEAKPIDGFLSYELTPRPAKGKK